MSRALILDLWAWDLSSLVVLCSIAFFLTAFFRPLPTGVILGGRCFFGGGRVFCMVRVAWYAPGSSVGAIPLRHQTAARKIAFGVSICLGAGSLRGGAVTVWIWDFRPPPRSAIGGGAMQGL